MKSINSRLRKKLSRKERSEYWSRLRQEDEIFRDLCDARDEVVRTIGHHDIVTRALVAELEQWDIKVEKMFGKLAEKEKKWK